MLKSKEMFNSLNKYLSAIWSKKSEYRTFEEYLNKEFDYPATAYMEYIIGARDIRDLSSKEIFWLIKGINNTRVKIKIESYFSEAEIREFSNSRYILIKEEIYPYEIDIKDELADDQWVTTLDMNQIKDLYNKQLIVYNPNTQRELKKIIRGGEEIYAINVNMTSVNEIKNLMANGKFIPNDLSFNLNLDNPDVEFDITNKKLVLYNGRFDIIDGFHRFKAAIMRKAEDEDFNFKFVINIMNFNESKACDYIAQEDKRNKISKDFRKSLDSNNLTNVIIDRINMSPDSLVRGLIGKEGTNVINRADLFWLVDTLYNTKKMSRSEILRTANHIINVINYIIDEKAYLLNTVNLYDLSIIIYSSTLFSDAYECANKAIQVFNKGNVLPRLTSRVKKIKVLTMVQELFD